MTLATDIYNKYGDTGITKSSDYRLVSEIENYKSKTSDYYERLNNITNYFNDNYKNKLTNFSVYMDIIKTKDNCHEYYDQIDWIQNIKYGLEEIENGNYYKQLENLESKIRENINSIKELQYNIRQLESWNEDNKKSIDFEMDNIRTGRINKHDGYYYIEVYKSAIETNKTNISENEKEIEKRLKDIENLETEFEKSKKEPLKKWLEYEVKNERIEYLTIPEEFIGEYFYKVS